MARFGRVSPVLFLVLKSTILPGQRCWVTKTPIQNSKDYWHHSHLIVQWFPPICQNAKNSGPIVSRLKFSSSHVSFVSLATVLSLGTGPDPLHFRQKPSVFFTKQCTLSNLWEPTRQNVTSLVLWTISISKKTSHLRSNFLSIGKSSNIQSNRLWTLRNIFSISPIPVVETLMVCLWNQTILTDLAYVDVNLVSNFWWPMKYSAIFGSIDIHPSLIRWAQHSQFQIS